MTEQRIALTLSPASVGKGAGTWVGGPCRLTGDPSPPQPTHRLRVVVNEAPLPGEWQWHGRRISVHREMAGEARGLVCGVMNIAAEARDEFEEWYETEHMPRLAALPDVLVAERYTAMSGTSPQYLALYRLADIAVSQSTQWMAAARTPWSARMRRFTLDYRRLAFVRDEVA